ncbi:MAG: hypothetical protein ACAH83_19765 [Alphaproteobacteria bacterium]
MATSKQPDKRLVNLAFRIKPLVTDAEGDPYFIRPVDIYTAKLDDGEKIKVLKDDCPLKKMGRQLRVEVPAGLREIYGPTIVQALEELPADLRRRVSGFTFTINSGMYSGEDMSIPATVTLYGGKLPQSVKDQPVIARGKKFTAPIASKPKAQFNASVETQAPVNIMKPLVLKKPDNSGPVSGGTP